jgi:calcium-dependent protein kinase
MTTAQRLQAGLLRSVHLSLERPHSSRSSQAGCRATADRPSGRRRRCITAAQPAQTESQAAADSGVRIHDIGFSQDFHKLYTLGDKIGRGAEGEVFIGLSRRSGDKFAVKRTKKVFREDGGLSPAFCERLRHQIDIYHAVGNGLSIAHLYGAFEDAEFVYSVQELCTGGELWQHIGDHYSEAYAARIMRYVLQTIAQFHAHGVVWRDVKPENFLFANEDNDSPLKAVDFGTAERCKPGEFITARAGSPLFVAPEVLKQKYNHSADMWGAGMLAYMILCARLPFGTADASVTVADLYSGRVNVSRRQAFEALLTFEMDFHGPHFTELSDGAQEFIKSLLQEDPEKRPTAEEALQHHWVQADAPDVPFSSSLVQRLQRFGSYNRFKQVVLQALVAEVQATDEFLIPPQLHAEFAALDPEGKGVVPLAVMRDRLQGEPFSLSAQEVERLLRQIDKDADDHGIAYDEWMAAMLTWRTIEKCREWDDWIDKAFAAMDSDGNGRLSRNELERFLCRDDICLSEQALHAALDEAHRACGDDMTLEDFRELITARPHGHHDDDADLDIFHARVSDPGRDRSLDSRDGGSPRGSRDGGA